MKTRYAEPYQALAHIYDRVMDHVNYKEWAGYIRSLLPIKDSENRQIVDLACGSGSFLKALNLKRVRLTGCDLSESMLHRARTKEVKNLQGWIAADFTRIPLTAQSFDAALVLYDSINYLIEERDILQLFSEAERILKPGGRLIFDAATPYVCETAFKDFHEKVVSIPNFPYERHSWYDAELKTQYNHFSIHYNGETVEETHQQKIRSQREWRNLIAQSPLQLLAAYSDFSFKAAKKKAERIHFVCEKG